MRAGTVVPGTSNQEEEADASVAENDRRVRLVEIFVQNSKNLRRHDDISAALSRNSGATPRWMRHIGLQKYFRFTDSLRGVRFCG